MSERRKAAASIIGLALVWGGTMLLISPAATLLKNSILGACLGQGALWMLFSTTLMIVLFWEKQPIDSLWLKPLWWQSACWAAVLFFLNIFVLFPITDWFRTAFRLPGYAAGMEITLAFPVWLRIVAVITAGIVEETLFRSYTITRLGWLSGSTFLGAAVSVTAFAALHIPVWGVGPSMAFLLSGAVMTAFFLWKRDLLIMIIAHIAIDAWALIVTPHFSHWWN
jgi:uncharacterized protein